MRVCGLAVWALLEMNRDAPLLEGGFCFFLEGKVPGRRVFPLVSHHPPWEEAVLPLIMPVVFQKMASSPGLWVQKGQRGILILQGV